MVAHIALLLALLSLPVAADSGDPTAGLPIAPGADDRKAVLELMKHNTQEYGSDVALLQGLLVLHSLQGKALLTAESRIVGFEKTGGRNYVTCSVASGVVLNDKEQLTQERRLERIWHIVLEPTLAKYQKFSTAADGLAIEIAYNHRPFDKMSEVGAGNDFGPTEKVKFYMTMADLGEYLGQRLGPQGLIERSRILLDDQPVKPRLVEATMPPPPPRHPAPEGAADARSAKL